MKKRQAHSKTPHAPIVIKDEVGHTVYTNDACQDVIGIFREKTRDKAKKEFLHLIKPWGQGYGIYSVDKK